MNSELIKTFLSLAETKNFNRTADLLYISQPTVTMRIKQLEQELGQQLFTRNTKNVELTGAGYAYLQYATKIFTLVNESYQSMKNYGDASNTICLAAPVMTWDYGPLRDILLTYIEKNPAVCLNMLRETSYVILDFIANKTADVGIIYVMPMQTHDVEIVPFFNEKLLLIASSTLDVRAHGREIMLADGTPPNFVHLDLSTATSQLAEDYFYQLPRYITTDHPSLHLEMIRRGFGVGLVPETLADAGLAKGEIKIIDCEYNENPVLYQNSLIYRKKHDKNVLDLVDFLLDNINQNC